MIRCTEGQVPEMGYNIVSSLANLEGIAHGPNYEDWRRYYLNSSRIPNPSGRMFMTEVSVDEVFVPPVAGDRHKYLPHGPGGNVRPDTVIRPSGIGNVLFLDWHVGEITGAQKNIPDVYKKLNGWEK